MDKYKLGLIQLDSSSYDIADNLQKAAGYIHEAVEQGADIICIPECFDTGYNLDEIRKQASPLPHQVSDQLCELAVTNRVWIVAGTSDRRTTGIYNSAITIDSQGSLASVYDKTHLCPILPIDETTCFAAGETLQIINTPFGKIGVSICYDIRFPELYRSMADAGVELALLPTAFPRKRIHVLETLVRARAIENQFFMATANQVGNHQVAELGGASQTVDPWGNILGQLDHSEEGTLVVEIDRIRIKKAREMADYLGDRQPQVYVEPTLLDQALI